MCYDVWVVNDMFAFDVVISENLGIWNFTVKITVNGTDSGKNIRDIIL